MWKRAGLLEWRCHFEREKGGGIVKWKRAASCEVEKSGSCEVEKSGTLD